MEASDSFQQVALRFTDPIQHDYEAIRPIMLADETVRERSRGFQPNVAVNLGCLQLYYPTH